jgi:hypothetical protein
LTRLYAEETFPLRVVEELRRLGHDVLTTFEDGRANQAISQERKEMLQEGRNAERYCLL